MVQGDFWGSFLGKSASEEARNTVHIEPTSCWCF